MGDRIGDDADLRAFLRTLRPHGRDTLRRVLIRDQAERIAISSRLMRYRNRRLSPERVHGLRRFSLAIGTPIS